MVRFLHSSYISGRVSVPWALLNSLHLTRTDRKTNARQETKIKEFITEEKVLGDTMQRMEEKMHQKTLSKIWQVGSLAVK